MRQRIFLGIALVALIVVALVAHSTNEPKQLPTTQQQLGGECVAYSAYCAINN